MTDSEPTSYADAGVDVAAGELAVELMKQSVGRARRAEVVGGLGGFAGLFDATLLKRYRRPLLATATDGVGTKIAIAQALDRHDTIGRDLVAMVADDLVVTGAEPLFMTDYIACGKLVPDRMAAIVSGIAEGCRMAGCSLLGGETAEHPGLMPPDSYDLAGAGTAVVEADELLGPELVRPGDVLVAMAASGLHSNGYSLARAVLLGPGGPGLAAHDDGLGRTVGEELLEPTYIYTRACLSLIENADVPVHAFSHITGGGIAANVARVLPSGLTAELDRGTWQLPPIFELIRRTGGIGRAEMETAFNMGVGMVAVVPGDAAPLTIAHLDAQGVRSWVAGMVRERVQQDGRSIAKGGEGGVCRLVGDYSG